MPERLAEGAIPDWDKAGEFQLPPQRRPSGSLAAGCLPAVSSDQGSQFTSEEWAGWLTESGIAISMDGKGGWVGVHWVALVERERRKICLMEHASLGTLRAGLEEWFQCY